MRFITSDRGSAALLLAAAAIALILAATPLGPGLVAARDLPMPVGAVGLHLTAGELISDGLLTVFFLLVAIELRRELRHGDLAHPAAGIVPAAAALGGVLVPAAIYLLIAGGSAGRGWPIPTATDIAFALGLLALLGRGLPGRVRAFLLGLAILDDLIAILLIAVVFPKNLHPLLIAAALVPLAAFGLVARLRSRLPAGAAVALLWVLGLLAWYLVARSGVHATLAGVALGLLLPTDAAATAERRLQPVTRGAILPLFAFTASLIRLEDVTTQTLGPVFFGVAIALPVGKLLGVVAAGTIATALLRPEASTRLLFRELVAVGFLAGVGFTVSLLMGRLAFGGGALDTSAVLGVLTGSLVAIVLSSVAVPLIGRSFSGHAEG